MKALFFDLDGTLLDSRKKIPLSAREALRAVRSKGVKVWPAPARPGWAKRWAGRKKNFPCSTAVFTPTAAM